MYGSSPPLFDVPTFPALRRMRPLPKRRRTSVAYEDHHLDPYASFQHGMLDQDDSINRDAMNEAVVAAATATLNLGLGIGIPPGSLHLPTLASLNASLASVQHMGGLNAVTNHTMQPPPATTAADLLAHTDSISAQMALQNYYMPLLGTVQDLLKGQLDAAGYQRLRNAGVGLPPLQPGAPFPPPLPPMMANTSGQSTGVNTSFTFGLGTGLDRRPGTGMNQPMRQEEEEAELDPDDRDYADQFHQPGNTKKRKVPANAQSGPGTLLTREGDRGEDPEAEEDGATTRYGHPLGSQGIPSGRVADSYGDDPGGGGHGTTPVGIGTRKGQRITPTTMAGLQHKEMVKQRKRQLSSILGAVSLNSPSKNPRPQETGTLALDQALSTFYPFGISSPLLVPPTTTTATRSSSYSMTKVPSSLDDSSSAIPTSLTIAGLSVAIGPNGTIDLGYPPLAQPKVRLSKRKTLRCARVFKRKLEAGLLHPDRLGRGLIADEEDAKFRHRCWSETSERLIATKAEINLLRTKFEAELSRQAAKAAKLAASGKLLPNGKTSKGAKRAGRQARIASGGSTKGTGAVAPGLGAADGYAEFLDPITGQIVSGPGGVGGIISPAPTSTDGNAKGKINGGKKKKRSALANASNPHHLRNYIPGRTIQNGDNINAGAPPLRFLSASIPPRRSRRSSKTQPNGASFASMINPADEWICPFCEYELFYNPEEGEDGERSVGYARAIRLRKRVLRRRRRARERAARAASGVGLGLPNSNSLGSIPPVGAANVGYSPAKGQQAPVMAADFTDEESGDDDYGEQKFGPPRGHGTARKGERARVGAGDGRGRGGNG